MPVRVAVDMDDTVLGYWDRLTEVFNLEEGTNLTEEDVAAIIGPYDEWERWMREHLWLWSTCKMLPGTYAGLKSLRDAGFHVQLVTRTPDWARDVKWKWLARWKPPVDEVTFVPWTGLKHEYSDAKWLIDDRLTEVEDWWNAGVVDTDQGFVHQTRQGIWVPRSFSSLTGRGGKVYRREDFREAADLILKEER